MREANGTRGNDRNRTIHRADELDGALEASVRLGRDVRFLVVAVGGGGVRVGREIARRHLRFVETVAINCDPRVAEAEEFDRRICLGSDAGDSVHPPTTAGAAGQLARAAEPALDRIFEGATFVTIVASLGGSSGTGILGPVLDAASRSAEVVSVFVVKPFSAEHERRAVADRATAALHFLDAFVEKLKRRQATLTVLDNDELLRTEPRMAFGRVDRAWADKISSHIEESMLAPAEALLDAERIANLDLADAGSSRSTYPSSVGPIPSGAPIPPVMPRAIPAASADVELTFEVIAPIPRGPDGL